MVYLKSVENVITLGKLIGLLFLFCLPLLSILFLKTKRNDLARPVMGTIFLVYICMSVCRYVCRMSRNPLFHVFIHVCVCTMLRGLICQGVNFFMCCICVCTPLRGSISQGGHHRCFYMCDMSRNPLFHVY